jgi:SAM-dependent methyltransferase
VGVPRFGIRTRARAAWASLLQQRHRLGLRRLGASRDRDYRRYLDVQLQRSLSKQENDPGVGARVLSQRVVELGGLSAGSSVLCVGCRNGLELDLFRSEGVGEAVGIDLFSQREDILVMDMHDLGFPAARFDAVYASHSLEHAYDVGQVLREVARVTRPGGVVGVEVPLGRGSSEADRLEFETLRDLRTAVAPVLDAELWADEQPARSATNGQGTAVARLVFRPRSAPAVAEGA